MTNARWRFAVCPSAIPASIRARFLSNSCRTDFRRRRDLLRPAQRYTADPLVVERSRVVAPDLPTARREASSLALPQPLAAVRDSTGAGQNKAARVRRTRWAITRNMRTQEVQRQISFSRKISKVFPERMSASQPTPSDILEFRCPSLRSGCSITISSTRDNSAVPRQARDDTHYAALGAGVWTARRP